MEYKPLNYNGKMMRFERNVITMSAARLFRSVMNVLAQAVLVAWFTTAAAVLASIVCALVAA
jgi:hypothetical protein